MSAENGPKAAGAHDRKTATLTIHMCVDILGVMRRSDKELSNLFKDDGVKRPGRYVRDWLKLQLALGKRVLPMGLPCEGFSYQTGCPGHATASNATTSGKEARP